MDAHHNYVCALFFKGRVFLSPDKMIARGGRSNSNTHAYLGPLSAMGLVLWTEARNALSNGHEQTFDRNLVYLYTETLRRHLCSVVLSSGKCKSLLRVMCAFARATNVVQFFCYPKFSQI